MSKEKGQSRDTDINRPETQDAFPMDLVGSRPVPGKLLKERGFSFFQENRKYLINHPPDANGIVRVLSECGEDGPDEDGFGAMTYYDWWLMDSELKPIPGVEAFYGYSPPSLHAPATKKKWDEQYAVAVEILRNRK